MMWASDGGPTAASTAPLKCQVTARQFPLTRELRALLEAQGEHTDPVQKALEAIIPHVFHREG